MYVDGDERGESLLVRAEATAEAAELLETRETCGRMLLDSSNLSEVVLDRD